MKSLRDQIREAAAFDESKVCRHPDDYEAAWMVQGAEEENARILPLLDKLADVAEAARIIAENQGMYGAGSLEDIAQEALARLKEVLK